MSQWVTRPSLPGLTRAFCERLDQLDRRQRGGEYAVALTGGESAAVFYDAWAAHGVSARMRFFWSDERLVPHADPDSNYKLAHDHLLSPGQVAPERIFAAPTELPGAACAQAYAATIRAQVPADAANTPRFPLIILGLGADGHTGSLFPGRDPYQDNDRLVRAVEGTSAHPHPRLTFTPKLINAAAEVWFVITGARKAWAVEQLLVREADVLHVPALAVKPASNRVLYFADDSSTGGRAL